jgi:hypothetical protein
MSEEDQTNMQISEFLDSGESGDEDKVALHQKTIHSIEKIHQKIKAR